jgi:hypothetical protein
MHYLDLPYKLKTLRSDEYRGQAHEVGLLFHRQGGFEKAVEREIQKEHPDICRLVLMTSGKISEAYGGGGGYYTLAFCVGLAALRFVNPETVVPQATPTDWDAMIDRERSLRARPSVTTLEQIGGIGLLEIQDVNLGYAEGYQRLCVDNPNMTPFAGFTGLATLHAHDLLHFASQRQR